MMNDIESQLIGSRRIREFLKNFSETQWGRIVKASVVMGIQELEKSSTVTRLSAKDIEDLVVSNENLVSQSKERLQTSKQDSQNTQEKIKIINEKFNDKDSSLKKAIFSGKNSKSNRRNSVSPGTKKSQQLNFNKQNLTESEGNSSVPNTFRNSFKKCAVIRRRDLLSNGIFSDHEISQDEIIISRPSHREQNIVKNQNQKKNEQVRSSSVPIEEPSAKFQKPKPPSSWRRPEQSNFMKNGCREKNRVFNEACLVDEKKRAKSLNPLIYPEWWGCPEESPNLVSKRIELPEQQYRRHPVNDVTSLDKRLQAAKETADKLDLMFKQHQDQKLILVNSQPEIQLQQQNQYQHHQHQYEPTEQNDSIIPPPTQTYYHTQLEQQRASYSQPLAVNNYQEKFQSNLENVGPVFNYQGLVAQQFSPPRARQPKSKQQNEVQVQSIPLSKKQARENYQVEIIKLEQMKKKQVPSYLKNVESKIRDKVVIDRKRGFNSNRQELESDTKSFSSKEIEIYVKPPTQKQQVQLNQQLERKYQNQQTAQRQYPQQSNEYDQYHINQIQAQNQQQLQNDARRPPIDKHYNSNQLQKINVADIAEGFLQSPFMTQFSGEEENFYNHPSVETPTTSDGKPETVTLQMSHVKPVRYDYNQSGIGGFERGPTASKYQGNQTLLSQDGLVDYNQQTNIQHRTQNSTYYNHNPFSYIQNEDENYPYQNSGQNNSSQTKVGHGNGMTQVLSNMNRGTINMQNDTMHQGSNIMFRSDAFDNLPSYQQQISSNQNNNIQQTMSSQNHDQYQHQSFKYDQAPNFGRQTFEREEQIPSGQTIQSHPQTRNVQNLPMRQTATSNQSKDSMKIDQYQQILHQTRPFSNGQTYGQMNPFQTKNGMVIGNNGFQDTQQQTQEQYRDQRHRITASQPFNYTPNQQTYQNNASNHLATKYLKQTASGDLNIMNNGAQTTHHNTPLLENEDNLERNLISPTVSEDQRFTQNYQYYNQQTKSGPVGGFTQILNRVPSTQLETNFQKEPHQQPIPINNQDLHDLSSSSLSNYTPNDECKQGYNPHSNMKPPLSGQTFLSQQTSNNNIQQILLNTTGNSKPFTLPAQELHSSSSSSSYGDDEESHSAITSQDQSQSSRYRKIAGDHIEEESPSSMNDQSSYFSSELSHSHTDYQQTLQSKQSTIDVQNRQETYKLSSTDSQILGENNISQNRIPIQQNQIKQKQPLPQIQVLSAQNKENYQSHQFNFNQVVPPTFAQQKGVLKASEETNSQQFQHDQQFHLSYLNQQMIHQQYQVLTVNNENGRSQVISQKLNTSKII